MKSTIQEVNWWVLKIIETQNQTLFCSNIKFHQAIIGTFLCPTNHWGSSSEILVLYLGICLGHFTFIFGEQRKKSLRNIDLNWATHLLNKMQSYTAEGRVVLHTGRWHQILAGFLSKLICRKAWQPKQVSQSSHLQGERK